jgi:hypothetical protein
MAEGMDGPHWMAAQIRLNEEIRERERQYWENLPVIDPLIESFHRAGLYLPHEIPPPLPDYILSPGGGVRSR